MINRKQKIEELMSRLQSLKRHMAFSSSLRAKMPHVTPAQWGVLMLIEQGNESTVKDVAATLGITSSAATQLVDGLVENGYVVRKEDIKDRRRVTLTLSRSTKSHVVAMRNQVAEGFLKIFTVLNDKEFCQYIALNEKLAKDLPRKN